VPQRKDYSTEIAAAWARVVNDCGCSDRYFCPTAGDIECPRHSGFATCCNRPRRHVPVTEPPRPPSLPSSRSRSPFAVPNIDTDRLNFDDFHPLDHTLATCTGYPGGRRRHLTYWWDFQARPRLHTATMCRLGLHKSAVFRGRDDTGPRTDTDQWFIWDGCTHCHKPLSDRQPL
jgi:hypothetical protein